MNVLLKSATIVVPGNSAYHLKTRDIYIKNGRIEKIAARIDLKGNTEVVALDNLHVSAGWFDSSVSFGEPGFEERETIANGLFTASRSGFTDIVLNPNTNPVPDSSGDIVFLRNAAQGAATALHPLGSLTIKGEGEVMAELYDMKNAGAVGFYDFKSPLRNSNLLKISLLYAQNFKGLVHSFPMDPLMAGKGIVNEGAVSTKLGLKGVPVLAETLQIARDLFILEYTGGALHIPTISSAGAVELISEAKKKGLDVSCSVAIHNLYFTDEVLQDFESNFKVMPPLRTEKDAKALRKGLNSGIIDFVTTDHIPMAIEEKQVEFDNAGFGTVGLESAFGVLNQVFGMETAVGFLTRGRERYGIPPLGIQEGQVANLALFNPEGSYEFSETQVLSTSKNSAFLGRQLKGCAYGVVVGNQLKI